MQTKSWFPFANFSQFTLLEALQRVDHDQPTARIYSLERPLVCSSKAKARRPADRRQFISAAAAPPDCIEFEPAGTCFSGRRSRRSKLGWRRWIQIRLHSSSGSPGKRTEQQVARAVRRPVRAHRALSAGDAARRRPASKQMRANCSVAFGVNASHQFRRPSRQRRDAPNRPVGGR